MKVLIAEDDPVSRRLLEATLSTFGFEVVLATDGAEAWTVLQGEDPPPLAILDWMMPEMNGVEICRRVRQLATATPPYLILLTAKSEKTDVVIGLDSGANDYLTKPFVLAEFLARVRALVRRGFHKGNARLRYADLELDRHRRRATRGKEIIPLTSKEFALLELFLLHAPDLVTRSEIVEHVWDYHFDSETNLVEVYINRLRQKIDLNGATKLIHTVRGVGYRLGMPE